MWAASGTESPHDILARSLEGAIGLLAKRVAEPEFATIVRAAFADGADRKAVADALADILIARSAPKVALLSAETLHGAAGAYDAKSDTIYLSQQLVAGADGAAIERVLLEEIGHAIDARLGAAIAGLGDSPGDEGAIFAKLVLGDDHALARHDGPQGLGDLRAARQDLRVRLRHTHGHSLPRRPAAPRAPGAVRAGAGQVV